MGIVFLASLVTGLTKLAVLWRVPLLGQAVLPLAWFSEVHDRAGMLLVILVFIHLFLNRRWIFATTKRILSGDMPGE